MNNSIIINYFNVCKNNKVEEQLKKYFIVLDPSDNLSYGHMKIRYDGINFDISIDRNQTHAGNQYIRFRIPHFAELKMPLDQKFDIAKFKTKLSKLALKSKENEIRIQKNQAYRKKIYKKFGTLTQDKRLTLNIDSDNKINVEGCYNSCFNFCINDRLLEENILEIRLYFKQYKEEQREIKRILQELNKET